MFRFSSFVVWGLLLVLVACQNTSVPKVIEGELSIPLIPTFEQAQIKTQDIATSNDDFGQALAISGNNLYAVGATLGSLDGPNLGAYDAFLRRYDGGLLWGRQFGSRTYDDAIAVVTDSAGNIYVLGKTLGAMGFQVGGSDSYLSKYSKNGSRLWLRQFGTKTKDTATDLAIDSNNRLYVLSEEGDNSFTLRKFNSSGSLLTSKIVEQNSLPGLEPFALAVDSLNNPIVLTSWDNSTNSKGYDIRLYKYDSNFNQTWVKAYSSPDDDYPHDITTDITNNIYFSFRRDAVNRGGYFQKRNANGAVLFTRRLKSIWRADTSPTSITTDSTNQVYIAGATHGAFPGFSNAGGTDIIVFNYTGAGTRQWVTQFGQSNYGSPAYDYLSDIVVNGYIYITGYTSGNLLTGTATSYGGTDAYIAMLDKSTGEVLGIDQ